MLSPTRRAPTSRSRSRCRARPYLGGGAESNGSGLDDANRLLGWLDLDAAADFKFLKDAFDRPNGKVRTRYQYTEADDLDFGRRIDAVLALP